MVGLGGLEPPTSPLSVLRPLVAEYHSSRYRMRSGSTIRVASGITLGYPTVRSPVSSLGKAPTGSQTESRAFFSPPFLLSNSRVVESTRCRLVTGCEDLINLVVLGGKCLAGDA